MHTGNRDIPCSSVFIRSFVRDVHVRQQPANADREPTDHFAGAGAWARTRYETLSVVGPARIDPTRRARANPALANSLMTAASALGAQATSNPPLVCGSLMSLRFQSGAPAGMRTSRP